MIIDQKSNLNNTTEVKSRESAIRGFFPFMESINFGLDSKLKLDISLFEELKDREICIMGFTWLLYTTIIENENNDTVRQFFKSMKNTKMSISKYLIQLCRTVVYFKDPRLLRLKKRLQVCWVDNMQ